MYRDNDVVPLTMREIEETVRRALTDISIDRTVSDYPHRILPVGALNVHMSYQRDKVDAIMKAIGTAAFRKQPK